MIRRLFAAAYSFVVVPTSRTARFLTLAVSRRHPPSPLRTRAISKSLRGPVAMFAHEVPQSEGKDGEDRRRVLSPPACVRGMTVLDKEAFAKEIDVPFLDVPQEHLATVVKALKPCFLRAPGKPPLQPIEGDHTKRILLDPEKVRCMDDLGEEQRILLSEAGIEALQWRKERFSYDNWSSETVLRAVLPEDAQGSSSFSRVGHILHLNLRDHLEPYKHLIGHVLMDKTHGIRAVVKKVGKVDSPFRTLDMELLAGDLTDTQVTVKENGITYKLDFAKVFWNPRLATEHRRIVDKLQPGDVLYDGFAGVGPFAVPAAKKKCHVLANDLNPSAVEYLRANAKSNKADAYVQAFNLDARAFFRDVVGPDVLRRVRDAFGGRLHAVMNLPGEAVNFLDAFVGLLEEAEPDLRERLPDIHVHVYCFVVGGAEDSELAVKRVEQVIGCSIEGCRDEVIFVRDVSTTMDEMRVSFRVPKHVLLQQTGERSAKKLRAE